MKVRTCVSFTRTIMLTLSVYDLFQGSSSILDLHPATSSSLTISPRTSKCELCPQLPLRYDNRQTHPQSITVHLHSMNCGWANGLGLTTEAHCHECSAVSTLLQCMRQNQSKRRLSWSSITNLHRLNLQPLARCILPTLHPL